MRRIATVVLQVPDGRVVLQRRSQDQSRSPGKLGLFGGHIEQGESADQAVVRELGEETSLPIATLTFVPFLHTIMQPDAAHPDHVEYTIYMVDIPKAQFEVYEGDGFEVYTIAEALARDDITRSTRFALMTLKEE